MTLEDFKRVVIYPKAVVIGLMVQLIVLPIVGFGIASVFPLDPQLAVGMMILAACPGGATSNFECGCNGFRFCDRYFNPKKRVLAFLDKSLQLLFLAIFYKLG
ncbi:MAG: hypothetical protein V7K53_18760 [Nostoc sp.]|uniref:bile acid:sodium symporter family protein n=1 Tax=Nostoc sp. TaxID=1180 RepID=UPI002FFBDA5C